MPGWKGKDGSRHQRGYGSAWERKRARIWRRDRGQCLTCQDKGLITPATQVDHVIPRSQGGTEDDSNLRCICDACHAIKTAYEGYAAQWGAKPAFAIDGWPVEKEKSNGRR